MGTGRGVINVSPSLNGAVDNVRLGFQIIWNRIARVESEPKHALEIGHRFG